MKHWLAPARIRNLLIAVYLLLAVVAAVQNYTLQVKTDPNGPPGWKYTNYLIFKCSHHHLLEGRNLYASYPYEHTDLFKYSPAFALFMGVFAWFPDWLGLPLWNLANVAVFLLALFLLPMPGEKQRNLLLLLCLPDVMTSLQNSQSNVLVAGLLIMGLALFERDKPALATLCLVSTFYIKIFGLAALVILFFYPERRKSMLYATGWFVFFALVPVLVTGFGELAGIYRSYLALLREDQAVSAGYSVAGVAKVWFGADLPKTALAVAALALLLLPLVKLKRFAGFGARLLFFAALLTWMVIFNHKAESPTFIIATAPLFAWLLWRRPAAINWVMGGLLLVFTSLSPTDLFPLSLRAGFFEPYLVKAVPALIIWLWMVVRLYSQAFFHR